MPLTNNQLLTLNEMLESYLFFRIKDVSFIEDITPLIEKYFCGGYQEFLEELDYESISDTAPRDIIKEMLAQYLTNESWPYMYELDSRSNFYKRFVKAVVDNEKLQESPELTRLLALA